MEQEVMVINEDRLEAAIEKLLLEDDKDLLDFLYNQMINSKYIKKKAYKVRAKAKLSSNWDIIKILHKIYWHNTK